MRFRRTEIPPILISVLFLTLNVSAPCLYNLFFIYSSNTDSVLFSSEYYHCANSLLCDFLILIQNPDF